MKKQEVKTIFEKVKKKYDKPLKLEFCDDDYPYNSRSNGCFIPKENKILVNWEMLKKEDSEGVLEFILHEMGHSIQSWWITEVIEKYVYEEMDKIKGKLEELKKMLDDKNKEKYEKDADNLGKMFYEKEMVNGKSKHSQINTMEVKNGNK